MVHLYDRLDPRCDCRIVGCTVPIGSGAVLLLLNRVAQNDFIAKCDLQMPCHGTARICNLDGAMLMAF